MKSLTKNALRAALKNGPVLLCFEILYKCLGFSLLLDAAERGRAALLHSGSFAYISQENFPALLGRPQALLALAGLAAALLYYTYFEITALILCCDAGWQGKSLSLWALCKTAFFRSLHIFHYKNLPVALLLLPAVALSALPVASGYLAAFQVPEFIMDYIQSVPALAAAFLLLLVLVHILLLFILFSLPAVILQRERFIGSLRATAALLKGKKLRTLLRLLGCILLFLLLAAAVFCLAVLALWAGCRWANPADGGQSSFIFHFLRWNAAGAILFSILGTLALCAGVVALYHSYRGDAPGQSPRRSPFWRRVLALPAALLLLFFFSESEWGGLYNVIFPGTAVVAHRAGAAFAPENTVAALRQAIEAQANIAEIDVQQTRDGALIVLHDANFKRTTGLDQAVADTDYAQVQGLDAGAYYSPAFAGEPVPTLQAMLDAARGKIRLMIELKADGRSQDLVAKTVEQIQQAGMERQCMIASMNLDLLRQAKSLAPDIATYYITVLLLSDQYDLDYVDGYSIETSFVSPVLVSQVHAAGKALYVWTANRDDNLQKILRLGADGVVTDNPHLARYYLDAAGDNLALDFWLDLLYPGSGEKNPPA